MFDGLIEMGRFWWGGGLPLILTWFFVEHLEWLDHFVRDTLDDAHSCLCLFFEVAQIEWHVAVLVSHLWIRMLSAQNILDICCLWSGETYKKKKGMRKVTYFGDQRSRCFQFQLVVFVGLLEDGDFGVLFAANTFACADQYVNGIHFMNSEIAFLVLFALGLIWILDDGFLAIDFGLLQLMTEHTFDWFAFEFAGNLLDRLGNCVVLWMWIVSWDAAQWNAFFFFTIDEEFPPQRNTYTGAWFE